MSLNAGDGGYGAAPAARLLAVVDSESTPLLVPEYEHRWKPLTTEELEVAAGGPEWRKLRSYLIAVFWLAWVAMLAAAGAIVLTSPRPVVTSLTWWQKSLFYQVRPNQLMVEEADRSRGFRGEESPYLSPLNWYTCPQTPPPKQFSLRSEVNCICHLAAIWMHDTDK